MSRRRIIATLAATSFVGLNTTAHAGVPDPPRDRTKLADRIDAALIEPGNGWWCRDGREGEA
jgi:hypothetical protein